MKKNNLDNLRKYNYWYFLNTGICDGLFNMACDEVLFNNLLSGSIEFPVLRLYGWKERTVSIGKNQKLNNKKHSFYTKFPVVKRLTGGQAVLHGSSNNELTYSIVIPSINKFKELYFQIGQILILFLGKYGINANYGYSNNNYLDDFDCFNSKTQADIVVNDIKVIGSAQYRKKMNVLQHGSIRLNLIRQLSNIDVTFNQAIDDLKDTFQSEAHISFVDYDLTEYDYRNISLSTRSVLVA